MSESVSTFAFIVLALASIGSAVMMLSTRNVVHAAFWLLGVMVATAGIYLLLSAEFLALVQVLVYAGAVAVLVLFVIMITLRRREDAIRPFEPGWIGAAISAAFLASMYVAIARYSPRVTDMPAKAPGVEEFGRALFTTHLLPFEVASLVLLVALVGSVWWAKGAGDK